MARTNTTHHGLSRATDASTDTFDFTLDHANLLDRLDAALRGVAASAGGNNLVNGDANNAGKLLSAQGDLYRGRVVGLSAGNDAYVVFQDNAGGTGADRYAVGYDDDQNTFQITYVGGGASLGQNGPYVDTSGNLMTRAGSMLGIANRPLQSFAVMIRNNAGTIEHAIGAAGTVDSGTDIRAPYLANRIPGASSTWTATGLSTGPFTAGAVLLSGANEVLILDTPAMDLNWHAGVASVAYNDTGSPLVVAPYILGHTVNGVYRYRLELIFRLHTGAVFALNTTNIPAGKHLRVDVLFTI